MSDRSLKCRIEDIEKLLETFCCVDRGVVVAHGLVAADGSLIYGHNVSSSVSGGVYAISFAPPLTGDYSIALAVAEDATNRDGRIIQWVDGSMVGAGFDVQILTGDNGGAADPRVQESWSFTVVQTESILICKTPEAPAVENEILIRASMFNDMGDTLIKKLRTVDIKFVEQLVALGPKGIDALPVTGIGEGRAKSWYAQACKIMEVLS